MCCVARVIKWVVDKRVSRSGRNYTDPDRSTRSCLYVISRRSRAPIPHVQGHQMEICNHKFLLPDEKKIIRLMHDVWAAVPDRFLQPSTPAAREVD